MIGEPLPDPLPSFACPTCLHSEEFEVFTRPGSDGSYVCCPACLRDWRIHGGHGRFLYSEAPARWWPHDLVELGHPTTLSEHYLRDWLEFFRARPEDHFEVLDAAEPGESVEWDELVVILHRRLGEGCNLSAALVAMADVPDLERRKHVLVSRVAR